MTHDLWQYLGKYGRLSIGESATYAVPTSYGGRGLLQCQMAEPSLSLCTNRISRWDP